MEKEVVITGAVRTAIGKFEGGFKNTPAVKLGAAVITEVLKRSNVQPEIVDEVIMGNVVSAGLGQNPARQAMIYAGLPVEVGALTVNKVCGSGLKAAMLGASEINAGDMDIIVAGGMENMTLGPYLLYKARDGYRLGDDKIVDAMVHDFTGIIGASGFAVDNASGSVINDGAKPCPEGSFWGAKMPRSSVLDKISCKKLLMDLIRPSFTFMTAYFALNCSAIIFT